MADMEDASKFADKTLHSAETFLLKGSSKKEQTSLIPSEKIQDSKKVEKELSDKPTSLKKGATDFLKGPLRFALGATVLAAGGVGFVTFMPLAFIGTGIGGAIGWTVKKELKKEGISQSADRLGAAAGATIGSLGATVLVAAGLKLMADAGKPKKQRKPLSINEERAKEIVEKVVQTVYSDSNLSDEEIKDLLLSEIEKKILEPKKAIEGEPLAAPASKFLKPVTSLREKVLDKENQVKKQAVEGNPLKAPLATFQETLRPIEKEKVLNKEDVQPKEKAIKGDYLKTPSELAKVLPVEALHDLVDAEKEFESQKNAELKEKLLIAKQLHEKLGLITEEQHINLFFQNVLKEQRGEGLGEEGKNEFIDQNEFVDIEQLLERPEMFKDIEHLSSSSSQKEISLSPQKMQTSDMLSFSGAAEDQFSSSEKPFERVAMFNIFKAQSVFNVESASFHFPESAVNYNASAKFVKGLEGAYIACLDMALKDNLHYQGAFTKSEAEAKLSGKTGLVAILYYDMEAKELTIASVKNGKLDRIAIAEDEIEEMQQSHIDSGYRFIENMNKNEKNGEAADPIEKMAETLEETKEISLKEKNLKAVEHDTFYQGIMEDAAVEEFLETCPPGNVILYYDPIRQDIVFSYREENGSISDFVVGENSFEVVKNQLINDGKLFLLNPEKEKLLQELEKTPHYHGVMDNDAVDALLAAYDPGSVVIHYNPEKQDVVLSYKEEDGNISDFIVGENSFETVMNQLIDDGKLFILNPEEQKKAEMQGNPYYQGEFSSGLPLEKFLLDHPNAVLTYYDKELKDVALAVYPEFETEIVRYPLGERSFEQLKEELQSQKMVLVLSKELTASYYHGTRSKEIAAYPLEFNEAMAHYDPESKQVLITYCDADGIVNHFAFDKTESLAALKDELAKEGIKLISKEDYKEKVANRVGFRKSENQEAAVISDQKVEFEDELKAVEFLHRMTQKKVNEYLNKFDKGIIWWQNGEGGKIFFSYKIDGIIKHVDKNEFNKDLPKLEENHHRLLRPSDLNKIIPKTLPRK